MGNYKNRRRSANLPVQTTRRCVVIGCGLSSRTAPSTISFHAFPKGTTAWVQAQCIAYLPADVDLTKAYICSRHYDPSFINVSRVPPFRRLLASNAIPTIFTDNAQQLPLSPGNVIVTDRSTDVDDPDTPESDNENNSSVVALAEHANSAMVVPPLITKPISPIASENESSSEEEAAEGGASAVMVEHTAAWQYKKRKHIRFLHRQVLAKSTEPVAKKRHNFDLIDEEQEFESKWGQKISRQSLKFTPVRESIKTDISHMADELESANTSIVDFVASFALVKAQCDRVMHITMEVNDKLPVQLRDAIAKLADTVNSVQWKVLTHTAGNNNCSVVEPQIEIYHSGVVAKGCQTPNDHRFDGYVRSPSPKEICEKEIRDRETQGSLEAYDLSLSARSIQTSNHIRDGIWY